MKNGDTHFVVDTNSPHDPPDCVLAGDAMTDLSFIDNYRRIRSIFLSEEKVHAVRDKTIRATDDTRNKKSYKTKVKKRGTVSGGTFVKDRIKRIVRMPTGDLLSDALTAIRTSDDYMLLAPMNESHVLKILSEVCESMGVVSGDVNGARGPLRLTLSRKIIYWRVRRECYMTYSQIGELFGVQHTTVLYGVNYVEALPCR